MSSAVHQRPQYYPPGLDNDLRNCETRYFQLLETCADPVLVTVKGKVVAANHAFLTLCGASRSDEVIGHTLLDMIHPDDRSDIAFRFSRQSENGEPTSPGEMRWIKLDGSLIQVECLATPLPWYGPGAAQIIVRDISERKRIELFLRESNDRNHLINRASRDVLYEWNLKNGRLLWNDAVTHNFGYAIEEMGHSYEAWAEKVHPDDYLGMLHSLESALHSQADQWTHDYRLRYKDGSYGTISDRAFISRHRNGKPYRLIGSMIDVTERNLTQSLLRDSEARMRQMADAMPQLVWTTTADGLLDYFNQRWMEITDFEPEQLPFSNSERWQRMIHPEDVAETVAQWENSLLSGEIFQRRYRYRMRDGSYRWHLGRALSVRNDEGKITRWIGTCTDTDAQKRAEEALEKARNELRQYATELEKRVAERTAALEESNASLESFSYSIAHDLRAPLRTIRGFTQALVEDFSGSIGPTAHDYGHRIISAAERMDNLIKDLLAYGRLTHEEINLGWVDLSLVVDEVLQDLGDEITRKRAVVEVRHPLPRVWGHAIILEQILGNFISNATKFMKEGVQPHIEIWGEETDLAVRIWVKDNGIGISKEYQERIFQVFERLHPIDAYPGTGIGLAIVRKAIERMHGKVGVESTPDAGSAFWIELPKPMNESVSE